MKLADLDVIVTDVVELNALIKRFHFRRTDGTPLPPFSGGSHIVVEMRDGDERRRTPYSLSSSPLDTRDYQICVRRGEREGGSSRWMHTDVQRGTAMRIGHPVNFFPLDWRARRHLMLAGGIGVTPFMAQSVQLAAAGADFELHYGVRSRAAGACLDELEARLGPSLHVYLDEAGERPDLDRLLGDQPLGTHLYACGPAPMIERVRERADRLGWPDAHVHVERFTRTPSGVPFTVELAVSGRRIEVGGECSLLEAIEAAGVDAPYLCRGGVCGRCETRVLAHQGDLLHADHWLDERSRAAGDSIMPCVSRCSGTLVLER